VLLIIDTETSGKLDFKKRFDAPGQPRILSIGGVSFSEASIAEYMHDPDPAAAMPKESGCFYNIIKPEGFAIDNNSEACKVNGITQELAEECGIPIKLALQNVDHYSYRSKFIGMYNAQFDTAMINLESSVLQRTSQMDLRKIRCLKIAYTSLCKLPSPYNYSDYKWPKLAEAYEWMFGVKPEGAHNAMQDARLTAWLAFAAMKQGFWSFEHEQFEDK